MYAMLIEKPKQAELGSEKRLNEAARFLKVNNHLYQHLYMNLETLYRYVETVEGDVGSIKVGSSQFFYMVLYNIIYIQ
jgi:hypothetical protein